MLRGFAKHESPLFRDGLTDTSECDEERENPQASDLHINPSTPS